MNTTTEPQAALNVLEVARRLDVHRRTVYRMIERGTIHAVKAGRSWRVPAESLQEFLSERTTQRVVSSQIVRRAQRIEAAFETLRQFRRRGIELIVQDGRLRYQRAPDDEDVPEDLLRAAARYAEELHDLVKVDL